MKTTEKRWVKKPEVLARLDLERPVVVEASAGTGKTYLLQHLVSELVIERGVDISQILVVTFTEKAAAELRTRVRETLRAVAHRPSTGAPPEHAWIVDDGARERALTALRHFDTATIGTIHQFCLETMRELGVLAGLPPLHASDVIPEPFEEAWRSVLRRQICEQVFRSYWAGTSSKERARIEDGAKKLTGTRAPPWPSLEQMQQEAAELVAAFRALGSPRMPDVDVHPFHEKVGRPWTKKLAKKLSAYRRWSQRVLEGLADHCAQDGSWKQLVLEVIAPAAADLTEAAEVPHEALAYEGDAFCQPEQRALIAATMALTDRARAVAIALLGEDVATTMRRYHDENETLTFNEMIWRLRDALEGEQSRHQGAGPLVQALRARYRWGLIDEFQDTDEAQWDIFKTLFLRGTRETNPKPAGGLVLVGDPKQAIYKFRGADFYAYQSAVRAATTTFGGKREALQENFRSSSDLLRAVLEVQAKELFPSEDGIELQPVTPRAECVLHDDEEERPLMLLRLPSLEDVAGNATPYKKPEADEVFAEGIAAEIARLLAKTAGVTYASKGNEAPRPVAAHDIAVLARTHADLDVVSRALRRAGVPFMHYKKRGLYTTPEALDLLDVLVAVQDPTRSGNVVRALATVFFPVAPARLDRYLGMTDAHVVTQTFDAWAARGREGDIPGLLRGLERDTGMMQRLLFLEGERSATNMQQLLEQMLSLYGETGWGLDRLVEELRRRTQADVDQQSEADLLRLESESARVRLMTMHTAKGLEFPVVFLMGGYRGNERQQPKDPVVVHQDGRSILALNPRDVLEQWRREEKEEDARLLYVAMTRAKGKLYLPWWDESQVRGQFRDGIYRRVKKHLDDVVAQGGTALIGCKDAMKSSRAQLRIPGDFTDEERAALAAYRPTRPPPVKSAVNYKSITRERRGPLLSSFTQLSDEVAAQPREPRPEAISEEPGREEHPPDETGVDEAELTPLDWTHEPDVRIPGSTLVGSAFHEVLEDLDMLAVRRAAGFEPWLSAHGDAVTRTFQRLGFTVAQREASARLVFETVRRPLAPALPTTSFCELTETLPELDFRMAIPERDHPLLGDDAAGELSDDDARPFTARTGFLTGSLDLVFRHEGRSYVVDWKTNVIKSSGNEERYDYSPEAVARMTEEKYGLQIEIYTLALVRWLGLVDRRSYDERFGGVLYVYLRGFGRPGAASGEGLYFHRPSFDEVMRWEQRLASGVDYQRRRERAPHDQAAWEAA